MKGVPMIKKIFSIHLARQLGLMGCKCIGTEPNRNKPWLNVYLFIDDEKLNNAMSKINKV